MWGERKYDPSSVSLRAKRMALPGAQLVGDPDYFMHTHLSLNPSWSMWMMEDSNCLKARKKEHLN